jgi:hypothetical protein
MPFLVLPSLSPMYLKMVDVGINALKAPERKKAGTKHSNTCAVKYSVSVSIPAVNILLMSSVTIIIHRLSVFYTELTNNINAL